MSRDPLYFFSPFVFLLACFSIVAIACHKSGGHSSNVLTATVGDSSFSAQRITATLIYGQFSIVANPSNRQQALTINFTEPFQLNVPIPPYPSQGSIGYLRSDTTLLYNAGVGTSSQADITITSWDSVNHRIGGNFSGVLYADARDSIGISNGSFNLSYSVQH